MRQGSSFASARKELVRVMHRQLWSPRLREASKPYVLTELGKQFVHYTMNEVVTRIAGPGPVSG